MNLTKIKKDVEDEIAHYRPSKKLQRIMRGLAALGYRSTGHGTDMTTGLEDFSFSNSDGGSLIDNNIFITEKDACVSIDINCATFPVHKATLFAYICNQMIKVLTTKPKAKKTKPINNKGKKPGRAGCSFCDNQRY